VRGHIDYDRLPALYAGFLAGSAPGTIRSPGERWPVRSAAPAARRRA